MRQLLWKEWHEQAWKLGFGCLMLGTLAALLFRARLMSDENTSLWLCYVGLTLLPILASIGLIPAERGDGTLEMLLALPLPRWRVLLTKMLAGAVQVAAPIALAGGVGVSMGHGREMSTASMVELFVRSIAAGLMMYLWMFAATARLPNEARAGMIAVGVLIIWELLTAFLMEFLPHSWRHEPARYAFLPSISPLAFVFNFDATYAEMVSLTTLIPAQLLIAAALWAWSYRQFIPHSTAE